MTEFEAIAKLVGKYTHTTSMRPSTWLVASDDFAKTNIHDGECCHAMMRYAEAGWIDTLITAVPKSDEVSLAYLRGLIDTLFKNFSDRIQLLQDTESDCWYLKCTNLDRFPANVLFNFCIASRAPIEYPGVVTKFGELVAGGLPVNFAILLSRYHISDIVGSDIWTYKVTTSSTVESHHFFLNPTSDWLSILGGNPDKKKFRGNYKKYPASGTPANIIWGHTADPRNWEGKTILEIYNHFKDLIKNDDNAAA